MDSFLFQFIEEKQWIPCRNVVNIHVFPKRPRSAQHFNFALFVCFLFSCLKWRAYLQLDRLNKFRTCSKKIHINTLIRTTPSVASPGIRFINFTKETLFIFECRFLLQVTLFDQIFAIFLGDISLHMLSIFEAAIYNSNNHYNLHQAKTLCSTDKEYCFPTVW